MKKQKTVKADEGKAPGDRETRDGSKKEVEQAASSLYTLRVFLTFGPIPKEFASTEISRTIQIKGNQTLETLHRAIFEAFDRGEEHLFEFNFGKGPDDRAGPLFGPAEGGPVDGRARDAARATVGSLGLKLERVFGYHFDFGDDWLHEIVVLAVGPAPPGGEFPRLVEKVGASPPQYPDLLDEEDDEDEDEDEEDPLDHDALEAAGFITSRMIQSAMEDYQVRMRQDLERKPLQPKTRLQAALNKQPAHWAEAMCQQLGLPEFRLAKERVNALGDHLPKQQTLAAIWRDLPEASRSILRWLVEQGGFATMQRVSAKFGRDTDTSWWWNEGKGPNTPLGILRIHGLVFVGTAGFGGRNLRIAAVPVELREGLARLAQG